MTSTQFKLQRIFRDTFDDPGLELRPELSIATYPDWDSVATVNLVLAIEHEFGIRFTMDEVAAVRSVQDILVSLEKRQII